MSIAEIADRRTFAIISHPDAGKTTLTEKFLLYAGALTEAGSAKARSGRRSTTSDWMEMEQKRGISITSTVLQFPYRGVVCNLLDTPGHRDFSEDTYRVLAAVDSVVMVLDSAKGIEPQTLKLFKVCRLRRLPVLTFLNKFDRPGRDVLGLLDEGAELMDAMGADLDAESFLAGESTPVFAGSALTNFGVRHLLDAVIDLAPPPQPRVDVNGQQRPLDAPFSALVFKVQANMDPAHRAGSRSHACARASSSGEWRPPAFARTSRCRPSTPRPCSGSNATPSITPTPATSSG